MRKILKINIFALFMLFVQSVYAQNITMMSENYPPYNMEIDGEPKGLSVDVLGAILKELKSTQSIKDVVITNWSRAYSYAQKKENHMVFSTTYTPERKEMFKWVGPIATTTVGLIGLKDKNIEIKNEKELKNYKIGTVLQDIGELMLKNIGINSSDIYPVSGEDAILLSLKKLDMGRIDLFAYDFNVAKYSAKLKGFDPNKYEVVYILKEGELYYAFNKDTDDNIIKMWQKALNSIKLDGTYQKIVKKY